LKMPHIDAYTEGHKGIDLRPGRQSTMETIWDPNWSTNK
jgi:hypothetical protein